MGNVPVKMATKVKNAKKLTKTLFIGMKNRKTTRLRLKMTRLNRDAWFQRILAQLEQFSTIHAETFQSRPSNSKKLVLLLLIERIRKSSSDTIFLEWQRFRNSKFLTLFPAKKLFQRKNLCALQKSGSSGLES